MKAEKREVTCYACGECGKLYTTMDSANKCCVQPEYHCMVCNKKISEGMSTCEECREKATFAKAKKMTYDEYIKEFPGYPIFLFDSENSYFDLEQMFEAIPNKEDVPLYCWGAYKERIEIDIDKAIESAEEDCEDSYFEYSGVEKLQKYISEWNKKYGYPIYYKTNKIAVEIPEKVAEEYYERQTKN